MATAVLPERGSRPTAIAPWWHTAVLIAFFAMMAAAGAKLQHGARAGADPVGHRPHSAFLYVGLIAGEWALVYYIWKAGLRRTGTRMVQLVGGSWASPRMVFLDGFLALATWTLWKCIAWLWSIWFGATHHASISHLLPRGVGESILWVLLSISAGISEELVFRGYLQRQMTAFTGRAPVALLIQAAVFGIAHGYQGWQSCFAIAVYGALFTSLALWRQSLRPGMIAHAWTDIAGGLLS
jgi:membrane protease YdiL (CAAX protease family)